MPANAPHDLLTTHSLHVMFSKAKEADVNTSMLDSEKLTALRLAEDLNSFFLTGDPGTGKTFTLLRIIEVLLTLLKLSQLGITASTGAAANRLQVMSTTGQATKANPSILPTSSGDCPPVFQATIYSALDLAQSTDKKRLLLSAPVGSIVQLKVGACIILHKNIGKGLFNGSMGIILDFYSSHHVLPPDKRAKKPQTLRSIHNIKVDDNGLPIHAPPGPVCTLRGCEQMLFLLVKFEIGSMHKHVLVLDEEFVFQSVKGNKEYMATHFQV
ncbi:uncharacterized protein F5147DRAFT_772656 [Suillus discolor]|uniref:Uncharacterized protein n=1 Tax=Suillus discolor TaxID=1912936 RepID=A0A9P7F9Z3_9AGAM|nr:uncharacterized protein F5147DRAFT_772656 [Suillus discolor]KAG2110400.1 hypothetical protein F5147DRAFT_772656 [Suillus discolor]